MGLPGNFGELQEALFAVFDFMKKRDIKSGLVAIREILDVVIEQVDAKQEVKNG